MKQSVNREERELTLEECIDNMRAIDPECTKQIVEIVIANLHEKMKHTTRLYRIEKALREILK